MAARFYSYRKRTSRTIDRDSVSLREAQTMTIDEIKELIHVVRETGIFSLEVQRGGDKVVIQIGPAGSSNPELILPPGTPVPFAVSARPGGPALASP